MRQLASIQKIIDVQPIPNADAIEVATVLGWQVVIKKGEFKVGDLCVYCEIDSIMPPRPEFAFLQPHFRIKTIRLRGQISQGICFPLALLGERSTSHVEGADVTELLGVTKYELPVNVQLAGKVRGNFPGFLPKTDEPRVQAFPWLISTYADIPFFVTEKVDGSSVTFCIKNDELHVASRNWDLIEDTGNLLWQLARELKIEEKLRSLGEERFAIQGEVIGEKIQDNRLGIKGKKILFFNAYDFIEGEYLSYSQYKELFQTLKLETVPIILRLPCLPETIPELVSLATRNSVVNNQVLLEGLVFRPMIEQRDEKIGRLSFKVINPEYLLKNKE